MSPETDFISLLSEPSLLQLMLFACPDGVIATDQENRIVLYTGASEFIFGFSPVEVMHRDIALLFATQEGYEAVRRSLIKDGRVVNARLPGVRKEAPPFPAAISAATMRDRYGDYLGTIAYVRDYTAVQAIEDALRMNNGELNRLVSELDFVAKHDGLTGLLNRSSAIAAANEALIASGLVSRAFSVVLFDLDHFKSVNDSYGHLVGDEVLAALGRALRQTARGADIIGRFGGEEFIAFLPGAELPAAVRFAERVRLAIEGTVVRVVDELEVQVTVSAGVAAIPSCADSLTEAIRIADDRLYAAKWAGRNRVGSTTDFLDVRNAA
ncbi:MAG: hypothetical protein C0506_07760 [Anaerolinea sp.]|nr:hypothetical protein [Anaerolinea sp.]